MTDLSTTIAAKSDQLNADDIIGQTLNIKITSVSKVTDPKQPISIHYDGDQGKPWKPCLTMRRLLIGMWGKDGTKYAGRRLTLYRDADVIYAGEKVGGVRISHASDIFEPFKIALTERKGSKKAVTILPLAPELTLDECIYDIITAPTLDELKSKHDGAVRTFKDDESRKKIVSAKEKRKVELTNKGVENASLPQ